MTKHEVRYESKTFLNLPYHYITRSPTYLCSYIIITSLRQKKLFGSPSFLLEFEEFQGSSYVSADIMYKTTSPPSFASAFNTVSSASWKDIKEQCDLFLMKINVCLFASTPAFIYSPNWMSEKGVFVKCHSADFFLSSVKLNSQNHIFIVQQQHNLMHQK